MWGIKGEKGYCMEYTKYYFVWFLMFITSFIALFFIGPEYMWWALAHLVLSFLGLMVTFIAIITDKNRTK